MPQLVIRPGKPAAVSAKIEQVQWSGLRCRVKVTGDFDRLPVDLRDKPPIPSHSLAESEGRSGKTATCRWWSMPRTIATGSGRRRLFCSTRGQRGR